MGYLLPWALLFFFHEISIAMGPPGSREISTAMDFSESVFVLKCLNVRGINMFDGNFALLAGKLAGRMHVGCGAPGAQSSNAYEKVCYRGPRRID